MALNVVTPNNLGNEFNLGTIEADKVHINFDGTSIVRNVGTGIVSAAIYDPMPVSRIQVEKIALTGTEVIFLQKTFWTLFILGITCQLSQADRLLVSGFIAGLVIVFCSILLGNWIVSVWRKARRKEK